MAIPRSTIATLAGVALASAAIGYALGIGGPADSAVPAAGAPISKTQSLDLLVGKPLPDITLSDSSGTARTSADFKGKYTVLFFSEGLMCYPACWNQIAGFGSDPRYNSSTTQAISVVVDSPLDWQKAILKMPGLAKATVMYDSGAGASRRLGMLDLPSSMHRGMLPGHTYILLDKEGIVRYAADDPNMSMANDTLAAKIADLESKAAN